MARTATVTFFYHSGVMIAMDKTLLIFNYWEGEDRKAVPLEDRLTERDMQGFERILFFVNHGQEDHFDRVIYTYNYDRLPITYIVSEDVPAAGPGTRLREGDPFHVGPVAIQAYGSTDLGVSYYVTVDDLHIFHAGSLNFWHWREYSTLSEIRASERAYYAAVAPLESLPIDIAMFPVDPRQGGMYDAGANHFIMAVKPRVFIPVHWLDKPEVAVDFARKGRTRYTEVIALTRVREKAELTFDGAMLSVHMIAPAQRFTPAGTGKKDEIQLNSLNTSHNPFSDTDLPVDLT